MIEKQAFARCCCCGADKAAVLILSAPYSSLRMRLDNMRKLWLP
jgi:hypothetical protein